MKKAIYINQAAYVKDTLNLSGGTLTGVVSYNGDLSDDFSGNTLITKDFVTGITSSLETELSTEISTRASADTSLSTAIGNIDFTSIENELSTEISTRSSADTSLSTEISTEISTRGSADTSLSTELSTEISTRTSADTSLSTEISNGLSTEISTRASADTSLSTELSTEISTRGSADTSLATELDNYSTTLAGLTDTSIDTPVEGNLLIYDDNSSKWINTNTINKDVTIIGDLYVSGTTTTINTDDMNIADNIILINSGETGGGVSLIYAGIEVDRGSLDNYRFVLDDTVTTNPLFKVGTIGNYQAVATRQDSPTVSGVTYWNNELKRFDTSTNLIFDSDTLKYGSTITLVNDVDIVHKKYVDDSVTGITSLSTELSTEISTRGSADTSLSTEINNVFTNVDEIQYNTGFTYTGNTEGKTWWDSGENTLNINTGLGSIIQSGQELQIKVYNNTDSVIPNGTAVYPNGILNDYPTIGLAQTDTFEHVSVDYGLTTTEVPIGGYGFVVWFGKARGLDTSMYATGTTLWISETNAGEMTGVRPTFPNYAIQIGIVFKSHETDGIIFVTSRSTPEDTFNNFWNGVFRETFDFRTSVSGSTILGTLTPANGNEDMTMIFSDGFSLLDTSPSITIELTPGTVNELTQNYVYVPFSTKEIDVSTSDWPTTQHIKVAKIILKDSGSTALYGAIGNQNWNDHLEGSSDDMGHLSHITERMRQFPPEWKSGVETTMTVDTGPTPDDVYISTTGGVIYQMHEQSFPPFETGSTIFVVNDFTTNYKSITNLNTEIIDSLGNTLNNTSFSFVLWGVANKTGEASQLMLNLPSGSYSYITPNNALEDSNNYSNYTIPVEFKSTGFLIARFTMTYKNDVWSNYETEDLRGRVPNSSAGGGSAGGGGVTTYLGLTDTPNLFTGSELMLTRVNSAGTAQEFTSQVNLDVIDEYSSTSGVTIDSVLNKDGRVFNNDNTAPTLDNELTNKKYVDDVDISLSTEISTEISNRSSADTSLSTELSSEISTRGSADTSLSTSISNIDLTSIETELSTEISTRGSADTSLSTELSTEISTRSSADTSLSTAIGNIDFTSIENELSSEISTRGSADTSLSTELSTEISTRGSEVTSLSTELSGETSLRISGDTSLATELDQTKNTIISTLANVGTNNTSLWLIDPKGTYYNGNTYVVYLDYDDNDRKIAQYNHATDIWTISTWTQTAIDTGSNTDSQDYAHGAPTIFIDSTGYIHISYTSYKNSSAYTIKSTNVEDITAFNSEVLIETQSPRSFSYTTMIEIGSTLIIFYRGGNATDLALTRAISTDGGTTWVSIIELNNYYSYHQVRKDINDRVHLAWHEYDSGNKNLYYVYSDDAEVASPTWKEVDGTTVTIPFTNGTDGLIFDSSSWDTCYLLGEVADGDGKVHIFAYVSDSVNTDQLLYFEYSNSTWNQTIITEENLSSWTVGSIQGDVIYKDGVIKLMCEYISDPDYGTYGKAEIKEWVSGDKGNSWSFNQYITYDSTGTTANPFYSRNSGQPLWYVGDNDYGVGKSIYIGINNNDFSDLSSYVRKIGTPVDNQIGIWTGDGTIEGTTGLTYNGTILAITGDTTISGSATIDGFVLNNSTDRDGLLNIKPSSGSFTGVALDFSSTARWSVMGDQTSFLLYDEYNNKAMLRSTTNAETKLYYNGSEKFATTSTGISVTGEIDTTGKIDFTEMTAPSNPASNHGVLYVADDGGTTTLYFKDSGGTTTDLLAGGGSSLWDSITGGIEYTVTGGAIQRITGNANDDDVLVKIGDVEDVGSNNTLFTIDQANTSFTFENGSVYLPDAAAALNFDTIGADGGGMKRITCNDGGANFAVRSGSYYDSGSGNKYTTTNGSAADILFTSDAGAGVGTIVMRTAVVGTTAGDLITYGNEITIIPTLTTFSTNIQVNGNVSLSESVLPDTDNTGNVGTSTYTWNNGQFTNMTIDSTLSVRGAIDLADSDILRFGSSDDIEMFYDAANFYTDFNTDSDYWYIRDNTSTVMFRFGVSATDGQFDADGDIIGYSTSVSDKRLKENVIGLESPLDKILKLRGINFEWKEGHKDGTHVGYIAQEIAEIIPEVVVERNLMKYDDKPYKVVRYEEVIPYITESIKEQQIMINELKEELYILKNKIK
jgi:endosialidase-like protein